MYSFLFLIVLVVLGMEAMVSNIRHVLTLSCIPQPSDTALWLDTPDPHRVLSTVTSSRATVLYDHRHHHHHWFLISPNGTLYP